MLSDELSPSIRTGRVAMTAPVIVGVEESDRSRDALALGLKLADGLGVELVAAYVHPTPNSLACSPAARQARAWS
jgi:hypothetical protein